MSSFGYFVVNSNGRLTAAALEMLKGQKVTLQVQQTAMPASRSMTASPFSQASDDGNGNIVPPGFEEEGV